MSYSTYYLKSSAKVLSATEIKRKVGVDPATYGAVGLATLGILTPVDTVQPFNTSLFDVTKAYTVSGTTATETYTAAAKSSLVQPKVDAIKSLTEQHHGHTVSLIRESKIGFRLFVTLSSMLVADRPALFAPWIVRRQAVLNRLATNIAAVNSAGTADAINDIVSPAWGCIDIAADSANPNNMLASDFTTNLLYSKNLAATDFELFFPQTNKTVSYSSGFAATTAVFTDNDKTVQIRRASNSLVVDEFCAPVAAAVIQTKFGYREYLGVESQANFY